MRLECPTILAGKIVNFLANVIHDRNVEETPMQMPRCVRRLIQFLTLSGAYVPPKTCNSVVNSLPEI